MNMFFMSFMDLIERFRMLLVEFGGYVGVKVEEQPQLMPNGQPMPQMERPDPWAIQEGKKPARWKKWLLALLAITFFYYAGRNLRTLLIMIGVLRTPPDWHKQRRGEYASAAGQGADRQTGGDNPSLNSMDPNDPIGQSMGMMGRGMLSQGMSGMGIMGMPQVMQGMSGMRTGMSGMSMYGGGGGMYGMSGGMSSGMSGMYGMSGGMSGMSGMSGGMRTMGMSGMSTGGLPGSGMGMNSGMASGMQGINRATVSEPGVAGDGAASLTADLFGEKKEAWSLNDDKAAQDKF